MTKKELLCPSLFTGLSIAFPLVCLAVYLSGGKSEIWIARKLGTGALLLGINASLLTGCAPKVTCHAQVATNQVVYEGNKRDHLNLSLSETGKIKGKINHISAKAFSYLITDSSYTKILIRENLIPDDGLLDASEETFSIPFPQDIKAGVYDLLVFPIGKEEQTWLNYAHRRK